MIGPRGARLHEVFLANRQLINNKVVVPRREKKAGTGVVGTLYQRWLRVPRITIGVRTSPPTSYSYFYGPTSMGAKSARCPADASSTYTRISAS